MEYIYGALLLHKLNQPVNAESLTKVIGATGAQVDEAKVKTLIACLQGVDIAAELANASALAAAPAAAAAPAKEEKKKEEAPSESAAGLASLFVLGTLITWSLGSTRRHRKALIFAGALMVNFVGIEALKALIHRARPAEMLIAETSFSFPSGHAAIAVVFCGLVAALLLPKVKRTSLRILLAVAATLLALF